MGISKELVKKLKSNPDFQEFTNYIYDVISKIDTVAYLDKYDNGEAGEIAKVRNYTKYNLLEILRPIVEYEEKKDDYDKKMEKKIKKFGLD